jgi:hypothetical protein
MSDIYNSVRVFFDDLARSECRGALRLFDATLQFRAVDVLPEDPPTQWFFESSGDWFYVDLKDGRPTFGKGDVRDQRDWKHCVLIQVGKEALEEVLSGKERPIEAVLKKKLFVGNQWVAGAPGGWVICLLRLGQVKDRYWDYLHTSRVKAFMKRRYT